MLAPGLSRSAWPELASWPESAVALSTSVWPELVARLTELLPHRWRLAHPEAHLPLNR